MSEDSVIGALKLELKIRSGLEAEQARAKVDTITDEKIIDVLGRVEIDYSRAGIDIDSMEIELGRVTEEDLPRVLESELRDRLDRLCGKDMLGFIPDDDIFFVEYSKTEVSSLIADSTAGKWEKLSEYLSEPKLPWDAADNFNPADIVIKAAGSLLNKLGRDGIVTQFSILDDTQLSRLGAIAESSLALMADSSLGFSKSASAPAIDDASHEAARSSLTNVVDMSGSIDEVETDQAILMEVIEAVRAIISSRASGASKLLMRSALWNRYLSDHAGKNAIFSVRNTEEDAACVEKKKAEEEAAWSEKKQDFPKDNSSEVPVTANTNEKQYTADDRIPFVDAFPSEPDDSMYKTTGLHNHKDTEVEDFSAVIPIVSTHAWNESVTNNGGEASTRLEANIASGRSKGSEAYNRPEEFKEFDRERTYELIQYDDRRLESVQGSQDFRNAWDAEEEEVKSVDKRLLISDAGLVLIHPFISRFMQNMKLVDEKGKFVSSEARIHAVHLLRHLTGFEGEHYEHCLTLEKVLCGLPVAYAVPTSWKASEHEEEEIDSLLNSVISYWASLSKSSTGALCLGFLQRPGSIEQEDGMYIVRVEGSAMDILLDDLPWGLSMIMLPWLEQPIIVEWQR